MSANIVGYAGNQCDTEFGSVLLTPQFVNVSSTTGLKLKDIKPVADTDYVLLDSDVDIQYVDNCGFTIEDKWYKWDGSKWVYNGGAKEGEDASEEVIKVGEGVSVGCYVDPSDATVTFQNAGQVATSDALIGLDQAFGSVLVGNPFPVGVTIGSLTLELNSGSVYELADSDVDIQYVDNCGFTIEDKWYKWDGSKWVYNGGSKEGQDASAEVIQAGEGVSVGCYVDPSDAIVTLRIPAPEL